jgi:hypothetical protein
MESSAITITLAGRPLGQPGGRFVLFADAANLVDPGAGFHHPHDGSNVPCFRTDQARPLALPHADHYALLLESIHDLCVVRTPQIQGRAAGCCRAGELGHRLGGILFRGAANRIGSAVYSPAELKTIQEVVTLIVFAGFTAIYFDEPLSW